jgi:hypothetical protein
MKRQLIIWFNVAIVGFVISSCNIKAPLEEILPEGNLNAAPYILLTNHSDTISVRDYLPQIGAFDSITTNSIQSQRVKNHPDQIIITANHSNNTIHEIVIWKNGMKSSLVAVNHQSMLVPNIKLEVKNFLNNVLFVTGIIHPKQLIVLWQNTVLPNRFVTIDSKGLSIFIPKEAKSITESTLRIIATNDDGVVGFLKTMLINGEPIKKDFSQTIDSK